MIPPITKTICVDFDNTLCQSDYPNAGPVMVGAKEALQRFKELGYYIIIWSCRTGKWRLDLYPSIPDVSIMDRPQVKAMIDWLVLNDIPFDEIDDGSRGKPLADFYVDEKAITFQNNWNYISKLIEYMTVEDSQIDF